VVRAGVVYAVTLELLHWNAFLNTTNAPAAWDLNPWLLPDHLFYQANSNKEFEMVEYDSYIFIWLNLFQYWNGKY